MVKNKLKSKIAMKKLMVILLFMPGFIAQAQFSVKGSVKDSLSRGIAFVTVSLARASDFSLVKATTTDEAGVFEFTNVAEGRYQIHATGTGFSPVTSAEFPVKATIRK